MQCGSTNPSQNLGVREFNVKIEQRAPVTEFLLATILILLSTSLLHRLEADIRYLSLVFPIILILLGVKLHRVVVKESVLIIPSLGVQLMQTTALGTKSGIRFVPLSTIKSVFINETCRKQHVITYLTLMLIIPDKRGKVLVPIFRETLPKLEFVTKVYREIHKVLLEFQ